jgi:lysophospholipid acyltransferase (LPLAT)-like uncharacterized protein
LQSGNSKDAAMKIRNPYLIHAASWGGAQLVRGWMATVRTDLQFLDPRYDPRKPDSRRCIYAFWHENMILPLSRFGLPHIRVLISTHADGQLIAEVARHLGFGLVRGSTTREGAKAVREMLRSSQDGSFAVTPDGPRGPRRKVQPGLVFLASRTGLPILPLGVGYSRAWRMSSWDRFAVPRPFSSAIQLVGRPIFIPENARREALAIHQLAIEQAIEEISATAEEWAKTGVRSQESGVRSSKSDSEELPKKFTGKAS